MRIQLPTVRLLRQLCSDVGKQGEILKIGNVRCPILPPRRPEYVPAGYASLSPSPEIIAHLKWLLQKKILQQDAFLIGPPGSLRSHLVLQFLELCQEEYEWLAITRDSTEADIKQRREIRAGNAFYSDLSAVRAALSGRVLVIDGVEKAERNVLPILNNLLENREMQLDDGRFLMHHAKFDRLKQKYSERELREMGMERVSEKFRVICLGLPVPRFPGFPLDPPLRSRFQSRHVPEIGFPSLLSECNRAAAPLIPTSSMEALVSVCYALNSEEKMPFPHVPLSNLTRVAAIWKNLPWKSTEWALKMLYPVGAILSEAEQRRVEEFLIKFGVKRKGEENCTSFSQEEGHLKLYSGEQSTVIEISENTSHPPLDSFSVFISTPSHEEVLAELAAVLHTGDAALLGGTGAGKSTVARRIGELLRQRQSYIIAYQDMNSRELLQSRRMTPEGDTFWTDSPLVEAARSGEMCVIEGVDRLHHSALSSLSLLLHHRRIHLPDGSRLVGDKEFREVAERTGFSPEELNRRGLREISSSFRVLLVGDTFSRVSNSDQLSPSSRWLTSPLISLTPFVSLPSLSLEEQAKIISSLVPKANEKTVRVITSFAQKLTTSHDSALVGIAPSLSLRRLIHIAKRDALHPGQVRSLLERATLSRFSPQLTRNAFEAALDQVKVKNTTTDEYDLDTEISLTRVQSKGGIEEEANLSHTLFYDNLLHSRVMCEMARDFRLGHHLLLIGNQGVGKNKITDHFLHLINRPRQYMQLHRDTTVDSLTIRRKVEGGLVKTEDSALVSAARCGHVLVVDEADKASLHVIAILKSLLDTGNLQLGDGRRILPMEHYSAENDKMIPLHPNFRVILLANRPGFPFLGNDLFGSIGDLCGVHVIENPERESEMAILSKYAPKVPAATLSLLVNVFSELRELSDEGVLSYPYSTREIVAVAKHLNEFPEDSMSSVVRNVFDFDQYSADRLKTVESVFRKHGIPLGVKEAVARVRESFPLPKLERVHTWRREGESEPITSTTSPLDVDWAQLPWLDHPLERRSSRGETFTEEVSSLPLPLAPSQFATSLVSLSGGELLAAAVNPPALFIIQDGQRSVREIELKKLMSKAPRLDSVVSLAALTDHLILIHEMKGDMLVYDVEKQRIGRLRERYLGVMDTVAKMTQPFFEGKEEWKLFSGKEATVLLEEGGKKLKLIQGASVYTHFNLPRPAQHLLPVTKDKLILFWKEPEGSSSELCVKEGEGWSLTKLSALSSFSHPPLLNSFHFPPSTSLFTAPEYFYLSSDSYQMTKEVSTFMGSRQPKDQLTIERRKPPRTPSSQFFHRKAVCPSPDLLVTSVPNWRTPRIALQKEESAIGIGGFLEVVSPTASTLSYVPVPETLSSSHHPHPAEWLSKFSETGFVFTAAEDGKVITMDTKGTIRVFEVKNDSLSSSFAEWKNYLEGAGSSSDRIEYTKDDFDLSKLDTPKIGKFDEANTPHVGGNTWAGGTGGYNTAGLGGVGGPFRLDAGHNVHQLSDAAKQQVPAHILEKAREIAKSEYAKKLKEIKMSEYDADAYDALWKRVEREARHLQVIDRCFQTRRASDSEAFNGTTARRVSTKSSIQFLIQDGLVRDSLNVEICFVKETIEGLEGKKKERVWMRHQMNGDLDDAKLIDGIAGDHNIYRRRVDQQPDPNAPQLRPKRLRVCMDVSGSMYRFNGYDKRLQRSMEAALLLMTSFDGKQHKVKYDLCGHSGDGPYIPFVNHDNYPKNNKERLDILREMITHSQFCASGDFTLEALTDARKELSKDEESDDNIVVLLSDANLERYGIRPKHLASILDKDDGVKAFVILIGSLGEQAQRLKAELPAGKAFICTDTEQLPKIMKKIFDANLQ